jgi:hypothetical protein
LTKFGGCKISWAVANFFGRKQDFLGENKISWAKTREGNLVNTDMYLCIHIVCDRLQELHTRYMGSEVQSYHVRRDHVHRRCMCEPCKLWWVSACLCTYLPTVPTYLKSHFS